MMAKKSDKTPPPASPADGTAGVDAKEAVRREVLRDLLGSGGLAAGRMSQEVLFLLPRAFVERYVELFWRGLKEPAKGTAVSQQGVATGMKAGVRGTGGAGANKGKGKHAKKEGKDGGVAGPLEAESGGFGSLQAQGGGKTYKEYWTVTDERMLRVKEGVDKELMRLSAEMSAALEAGKNGEREKARERLGKPKGSPQCLECRRFLRATDRYCSGCGRRV